MSRAQRRHQTKVKHERRQRLFKALHPWADEIGHKAKFWPMRCRCDWCIQSKRRDLESPSASPEAADHDWRRG